MNVCEHQRHDSTIKTTILPLYRCSKILQLELAWITIPMMEGYYNNIITINVVPFILSKPHLVPNVHLVRGSHGPHGAVLAWGDLRQRAEIPGARPRPGIRHLGGHTAPLCGTLGFHQQKLR